MDFVIRLLREFFLPLLKVDLTPPHLPEDSSLVRQLKPSPAWLTFKYLRTLFGSLNQVIGTGVLAVIAITNVPRWGVVLAVILLVMQLFVMAFSLVVTRIDWELRHYLVGDRSLRVSSGAWVRKEVTVSYANVQNIEVTQGPIERLFGFKTLMLSTAGAESAGADGTESLHVVSLPGLENADEIRTLMYDMLKHERDAGLGEPQAAPTLSLSIDKLIEVRDAALALGVAAQRLH